MSTLFHWSQFIYAAPSSWTEVPSVRDSPEAQLGSSLSTVATVCVCVLARECEREADVASESHSCLQPDRQAVSANELFVNDSMTSPACF